LLHSTQHKQQLLPSSQHMQQLLSNTQYKHQHAGCITAATAPVLWAATAHNTSSQSVLSTGLQIRMRQQGQQTKLPEHARSIANPHDRSMSNRLATQIQQGSNKACRQYCS
jgi:hypothetical protein